MNQTSTSKEATDESNIKTIEKKNTLGNLTSYWGIYQHPFVAKLSLLITKKALRPTTQSNPKRQSGPCI